MAAPTPSTYSRQIGRKGLLVWNAVWANTDNMSDVAVIDLSAQADDHTNALIIERIAYKATAGIEFTLEFDATSDEFLYTSILGDTGDTAIDFTWGGREGLVKTAAGGTGDLVIPTTSAASADEITLVIHYAVR